MNRSCCLWLSSTWAPIALLLFAGCVNLSVPWGQTADARHEAGPGLGGTTTGGTTGVTGSGGVSGGSDALPPIDSPATADAGGSIDVPLAVLDGPTADRTTGLIDSPLVGTEAGNLPGIDGNVADGTGGAGGDTVDTPTGGTGGARGDGSLDADIARTDGGGGSGTGGATGTGGAGGVSSVGLVAYYPCDQTAGPTLSDLSGNSRDATLATGTGGSGGYTFAQGKVNNALDLVKPKQGYASIAASGLSGATEMTIATWVYLNTSAEWQRVWDFGTDTSVNMFLSPRSGFSQKLYFGITVSGNGNEQGLNGAAELPLGAWKHVAVVLGSGGGFLYLDGQLVDSNSGILLRPADLGNTPNNFIGKSQYPIDPYLDGRIDEFRVYSRALSVAEIQALYTYTGT
jgi:hypothetical protein